MLEVGTGGLTQPSTPHYTYDELISRDKTSRDLFWLRDESLEAADNLPLRDVLVAEIAEDLRNPSPNRNALSQPCP